jgi:hypothetical protein
MDTMTAHREGQSVRCPNAGRAARFRACAEYVGDGFMTPTSQGLESP